MAIIQGSIVRQTPFVFLYLDNVFTVIIVVACVKMQFFLVYVDVSMLTGPLMLSVLSNMSYRKRFRIRICQLSQTACITPNNCLQYYTGTSGVIQSFNYDQALMLSRSSPSYFVSVLFNNHRRTLFYFCRIISTTPFV